MQRVYLILMLIFLLFFQGFGIDSMVSAREYVRAGGQFLPEDMPLRSVASETLHYRIKPVPTADRTDLEISLAFKTDSKEVRVKLPADYFGTPDLHRFVTLFEGEPGTLIKAGEKENERIIVPDADGEIRLRYVLSYDPKQLVDATYSPNVGPRHFHAAGCQWMLQIGGFEEKHRLNVEMIGAPKNWQMYSSLSANPLKFETTASFQDLIQTAVGGGEQQNFRQFFYKGKPVSVFIQGKFAIPNREIFASVQKIVSLQRDWFEDYKQPFYNVVILPKEDNVAGVRFENQFTCFIKTDTTREQLYVILSHEMLHNWLTTSLIKPEKGVSGLRYAWFYEGVNDYAARKILFDAGLLKKERFAYLINRDIINITDNPNRAAAFDELTEAVKSGKYNQAFNKLSYYRGALMALNWENQIRQADRKSSFKEFLRAVYNSAKAEGISERQFFELAKEHGADAKSDFERYIVRGEPIKPDPDALGNTFELRETAVPSFEPGFTVKDEKITGVKANSPAFRAGIREGMKVIKAENTNRFSNAWDPDKPVTLIIEEKARRRRIEFFPRGESNNLLLFQPARRKNRR